MQISFIVCLLQHGRHNKHPILRKVYIFIFQLFDDENHVNQDASNYIFSTEGHIFRLDSQFRKKSGERKSRKFVRKAAKTSYTRSPGSYNDSIGVSSIFFPFCFFFFSVLLSTHARDGQLVNAFVS